MIGDRNGAMSMAPMITAAELVTSPKVAMQLDSAVSSRKPAVNREERRRSPIERKRHHGTRWREVRPGDRPVATSTRSSSPAPRGEPEPSTRES